jgi:hypothetical protein
LRLHCREIEVQPVKKGLKENGKKMRQIIGG